MTTPFRDEDAGALLRLEHLEDESERLASELETLCDEVGENGDAYVRNIENQVAELRRENGGGSTSTSGEALVHRRELLARAAGARDKAKRFRVQDDKAGAFARAERLETNNDELRKEIDLLKDRSGASRTYVERLEKDLAALKAENVELREKQAWKPQVSKRKMSEAEKVRLQVALIAALLIWGMFVLIQWLRT